MGKVAQRVSIGRCRSDRLRPSRDDTETVLRRYSAAVLSATSSVATLISGTLES